MRSWTAGKGVTTNKDTDVMASDSNFRNCDSASLELRKQIWQTVIPQMEVLRPGWHEYLEETLVPLYDGDFAEEPDIYKSFITAYPDWENSSCSTGFTHISAVLYTTGVSSPK